MDIGLSKSLDSPLTAAVLVHGSKSASNYKGTHVIKAGFATGDHVVKMLKIRVRDSSDGHARKWPHLCPLHKSRASHYPPLHPYLGNHSKKVRHGRGDFFAERCTIDIWLHQRSIVPRQQRKGKWRCVVLALKATRKTRVAA